MVLGDARHAHQRTQSFHFALPHRHSANTRPCRLRSPADSIHSGRHILAFTMRRVVRKRRVFEFVPKVARNEVKNESFAQRSAHRDSRISQSTRPQSASEARAAVHFERNWPIPTHTFCYIAIFHPTTPCNVWFFWVSRQNTKKTTKILSFLLAKSMEIFSQTPASFGLTFRPLSQGLPQRIWEVISGPTVFIKLAVLRSCIPHQRTNSGLQNLRQSSEKPIFLNQTKFDKVSTKNQTKFDKKKKVECTVFTTTCNAMSIWIGWPLKQTNYGKRLKVQKKKKK